MRFRQFVSNRPSYGNGHNDSLCFIMWRLDGRSKCKYGREWNYANNGNKTGFRLELIIIMG